MALEDDEDQPNGIETSPQSDHTLLTEIIVQFLSRLPVDSLLRCRSVCKSWRSLISDPRFVKSHLTLSTRNNHFAHHKLIFSTRLRIRKINLNSCPLYDVLYDNSINDALELDYPLKRQSRSVRIVGSCNGLVCIAIDEYAVIIWNPSTRKSSRLPGCGCQEQLDCYVWFGFGYVESNDDYKVVEISSIYNDKDQEYETSARICSLKNGNWKNIGAFPCILESMDSGKFSNGALHWETNIESPSSWTIVSLDLAEGTFGEVLQPVYDAGHKHLKLGSLRECLSVFCNYHGTRADLWVMKVYGVKDSWTKLVSIPNVTGLARCLFSLPLCISNDGKILLKFGSGLIVYDSKNSSASEIQNFDCIQASTFVESMVSPMPVVGLGDRDINEWITALQV